MRLINLSSESPEWNLACDEAILEAVAQGEAGDTLRLWESPQRFVVLGTGQQAALEANLETCRADDIRVLRRCSAGGCVLQGPGSLNYSLALRLESHPELRSLHESYCTLLNRLRAVFREAGCVLDHAGTSDLALGGLKVSGNAQRRKREAILHHGTLLHAPDFAGMTRYLREPQERPEYRGKREHASFVGFLPFERGQLEAIVSRAFDAESASELTPWEQNLANQLAVEKYRLDSWNLRR